LEVTVRQTRPQEHNWAMQVTANE
ncbi:hypothetical protein HKBW3S43_00457, partial [Candidatus Hakubella thermalkaliphila]